MNISSDDLIAGFSAIQIRNFLRRYSGGMTFSRAAVGEFFSLTDEEAKQLIQGLETHGLICWDKRTRAEWYLTTPEGNRLANASAARPITRATAKKALDGLLQRIEVINRDPQFPFRVSAAVVFGSYLSDKDRLGDVDVAIQLACRTDDEAEYERLCDERIRLAYKGGRNLGGALKAIYWPRKEVFLRLKKHSRTLSLHELDELKKMESVRYMVLAGDQAAIQTQIPNGEVVE
jgi:predicted nucleotidyltransferase